MPPVLGKKATFALWILEQLDDVFVGLPLQGSLFYVAESENEEENAYFYWVSGSYSRYGRAALWRGEVNG